MSLLNFPPPFAHCRGIVGRRSGGAPPRTFRLCIDDERRIVRFARPGILTYDRLAIDLYQLIRTLYFRARRYRNQGQARGDESLILRRVQNGSSWAPK
jgi:hypothetical protein